MSHSHSTFKSLTSCPRCPGCPARTWAISASEAPIAAAAAWSCAALGSETPGNLWTPRAHYGSLVKPVAKGISLLYLSMHVYAYMRMRKYIIYMRIYIYTIIARNFCSMLVSTTTSCQEVDRPDRIKQVDLSCRKLPPCCIDVRWCKMFHHVEPASRGMSFQLALKLRSLLLMQSWSLGPIMTHDCQDKICPSIPRVPTSYSPAGHFVGAFVSRSLTPCHGDWLASCASLNLHFAGGRTNH